MKYFICVLIVIVSGCSGANPTILPEKNDLKIATFNHKHKGFIEIKDGAVNESSISVSIISNHSEWIWSLGEVKYAFSREWSVLKLLLNYHF